MPTIKEFREFFLREVVQTSGTKPDQEANYPTSYLVRGKTVFNRLLRNHFPSEGVMKKLLESVGFKLNPEDTASTSVQGFVKKASDTAAEARTLNQSSDVTTAVTTHQLPEVVGASDGSDAVVVANTYNGIKITTLKRTLSGLFRRNYLLEILLQDSVVFDGSTKKMKLDGDASAPGNNMLYGTNAAGARGWYAKPEPSQGVYLTAQFNAGAISVTPAVIGASGNELRLRLLTAAAQKYKFTAILFVQTIDVANGIRVGMYAFGGLTVNAIKYEVEIMEDNTTAFALKKVVTAINTDAVVSGPAVATLVRISGTVDVSGVGDLEIRTALNLGAAGPTPLVIGVGSYLEGQKLIITKPNI